MKKSTQALLILILLFFLSGCSLAGVDAEGIMRPPKATGEQAGIQLALEKTASGNVTFKYPRTGDFRSAIVMYDLNGDDEKEAIAFFRPQTEGAGAHMCLLEKKNGEWRVLCEKIGPGADVDRLVFADFDNNGSKEIIVGWTLPTTRDKSCSVYKLDEGRVNELMANEFYTEMAAFDIDRDGKDELLTVFSSDQGSAAKLLSMNDSTMEKMDSVRLDPAITNYTNVQTTHLDSETPALILDGYVSSSTLATEILYWNEEKQRLLAPFNDETGNAIYKRDVSFPPMDINKDGNIDFPKQIGLPGMDVLSETLPQNTAFSPLIEWSTFNKKDESFTHIGSTLVGPTEEVWLNIDLWEEKLSQEEIHFTALQNNRNRSLSLYEYDPVTAALSEPLFTIQAFGQYVWENRGESTKGFQKIESPAGIILAIRFGDNKKISYSLQSLIISSIEVRTE